MSASASQCDGDRTTSSSIGPLFAAIPARVLRRYLWRYLDVPELLALTQTCWTFFVQCNEEELWRCKCLSPPYVDAETKRSHFTYNGSWKHTVCAYYYKSLRWQLSELGAGRDQRCYGEEIDRCRESRRVLLTCRSVAEASIRFNVVLPRIVQCLCRDGVLSEAAYADWTRRFRALSTATPEMTAEMAELSMADHQRSAGSASTPTSAFPSAIPSRDALLRWWQEEVNGKLSAPQLARHYLQLSTGAINYFVEGGRFLRPPSYALRRGNPKAARLHTEFSDNNWAGVCLLDLVPLPSSLCTVEVFLATMRHRSSNFDRLLHTAWNTAEFRCAWSDISAAVPPLPDEQRGVRGVVDRRCRLSVEAFRREYEAPNVPVVLTGCMEDWPARRTWQDLDFFHKFATEPLKANGRTTDGRRFRMEGPDYVAYATAVNGEKPMYIFDKKVLSRCPNFCRDYKIPPYFQEDYFAYMAEDDRPDYRWVLVGPDGSGTPFHTDPHGTSAWNAVVSGCKRVTFYPPHVVPPGVEERWIHSEYYASEPYLRWYRERAADLPCGPAVRGTFSKEHRLRQAEEKHVAESGEEEDKSVLLPLEALVFPGDVIFIPSGWWHQVLNIGFTTAVTQNFCSRHTFPRVVADMNAYADRQVRKDFQVALRRAGRDELAVQLRVPASP